MDSLSVFCCFFRDLFMQAKSNGYVSSSSLYELSGIYGMLDKRHATGYCSGRVASPRATATGG